MNQVTKRYIVYARVNTVDEDPKGNLDDQVDALVQMAKRRGLGPLWILTDIGSAASKERPGFQEMLRQLSEGEARGVLTLSLDRLARSVSYFLLLVEAIEKHGAEIITPTDEYAKDSVNKLMLYFHIMMMEFERLNLSRRIKRGLELKKQLEGK